MRVLIFQKIPDLKNRLKDIKNKSFQKKPKAIKREVK